MVDCSDLVGAGHVRLRTPVWVGAGPGMLSRALSVVIFSRADRGLVAPVLVRRCDAAQALGSLEVGSGDYCEGVCLYG